MAAHHEHGAHAEHPAVSVKRAYEDSDAHDGTRVLVDRLWPRGLTKEAAHIDVWPKEVAPSTELRQWYGHSAPSFAEFRRRYLSELKDPEHAHALDELRGLAADGHLTLITATKDASISHAAVLADILGKH